MERAGNLADLTLVSKCHRVANYSYPRNGTVAPCSARSSLGSEGSAPGLTDDRTDSEVSVDDDYQYRAHMAEPCDSFWRPGARGKTAEEPLMHPRKQYPALIPSPRNRRRRQPVVDDRCAAWPLPDGSSRERSRKPAATYAASPASPASPASTKPTATYSAFPMSTMLPPRTTSMAPARAGRSGPSPMPCRPPRPSDELLTPCIRQPAMVPAVFAAPDHLHLPPLSPTMDWRPFSPFVQRASKSLDEGSTRPLTARADIYTAASRSSTHLPLSRAQTPTARVPRHHKSIAHLAPPLPPQSQSRPEPEPHSVFEYDDSESEGEHGRSLFRFHKRSDSDNRRSSKPAILEPSTLRHRRRRALTAPSSPIRQQPDRLCKQETPGRKRQGHDVFGRMLGRRSR
ncbi:hypothetical protein TOPH_05537 [Tolypocladium ophioglossoides CBS 100239]|uniref:Uncharacterized protein n=1 Tax=Tolypocladium ophioglossoides (strain CBS 100239) TaxID=1163406 RepID=A0A0L0N7B6_TOLOC|nr:hypothetical protein TOPH_05537 [Tolypocladium ophioglossoides CBS 100239]